MSAEQLILEEVRRTLNEVRVIREVLVRLLGTQEEILGGVGQLARGHNGLVRLIVTQGADMSAVSDAILAEDAKAVALIESVKDLINKLNNGNNTLDAETQAALQQVDGHLNTVSQEVADAQGATQPPAAGTTPAEGDSQPFSSGPDAGAVGV